MRNLLYLNGDGMVNVHPQKDTVQINDEYYCEMSESEFLVYVTANELYVNDGKLMDIEDGYVYGTVLVRTAAMEFKTQVLKELRELQKLDVKAAKGAIESVNSADNSLMSRMEQSMSVSDCASYFMGLEGEEE